MFLSKLFYFANNEISVFFVLHIPIPTIYLVLNNAVQKALATAESVWHSM
jgi:hypothetical protein